MCISNMQPAPAVVDLSCCKSGQITSPHKDIEQNTHSLLYHLIQTSICTTSVPSAPPDSDQLYSVQSIPFVIVLSELLAECWLISRNSAVLWILQKCGACYIQACSVSHLLKESSPHFSYQLKLIYFRAPYLNPSGLLVKFAIWVGNLWMVFCMNQSPFFSKFLQVL